MRGTDTHAPLNTTIRIICMTPPTTMLSDGWKKALSSARTPARDAVAHLQLSKRLRNTPATEAHTGTRTHRPARPAVGNRPRLAPTRPARAADQTPTDRQKSDKLTNKQTGRLTDKPIYRQTGRQTDRPTVRPTDRQTNRQTDRHTGRQTARQTRNTIKRASRSVLEWSGRLLATATALALALRVCALGLRGCLRLRLRLSAICHDLEHIVVA